MVGACPWWLGHERQLLVAMVAVGRPAPAISCSAEVRRSERRMRRRRWCTRPRLWWGVNAGTVAVTGASTAAMAELGVHALAESRESREEPEGVERGEREWDSG